MPITVKRPFPINVLEQDRAFYSRWTEAVLSEPETITLENVTANADGILTRGTKILPESFPDYWESPEWKWEWNLHTRPLNRLKHLAKTNLASKKVVFSEPALWITDTWTNNYYHWFEGALTRLAAAPQLLESHVLILPIKYKRLEYVQASLKCFTPRRLKYIEPGFKYVFKALTIPLRPVPLNEYNPTLLRSVRDTVLACCASQRTAPTERLYISRKKASVRKVLNEDAIISILERRGFRILVSESLPYNKQVDIFSRAECLVSSHGAGLTNMLYMPEGGSVLELMHEGIDVRAFFCMAGTLNHRYFYQRCHRDNSNSFPGDCNLIVDESVFERNLDALLST